MEKKKTLEDRMIANTKNFCVVKMNGKFEVREYDLLDKTVYQIVITSKKKKKALKYMDILQDGYEIGFKAGNILDEEESIF